MFFYWAYGLTIQSEIYFPELFPAVTSLDTDVQIKIGAIDSFVQFSPNFHLKCFRIVYSSFLHFQIELG